jgi:hypothetical protein
VKSRKDWRLDQKAKAGDASCLGNIARLWKKVATLCRAASVYLFTKQTTLRVAESCVVEPASSYNPDKAKPLR